MEVSIDTARAVVFLVASFVFAGLLHTLWLRSALSRRLAIPIDGRRTFRGRRLLGDNKTWRGFMVMVPATGLAFVLVAAALGGSVDEAPAGLWPLAISHYGLLGAWAGLGFMLGELPNSFFKRRCGIAPGAAPERRGLRPFFFVLDRIDSVLGMLVAMSLVVSVPLPVWAWLLVIGPGVHLAFSALLWGAGVKSRIA